MTNMPNSHKGNDDDRPNRRLYYNTSRLYNSELKDEYLETAIDEESTKITAFYEFLKAEQIEKYYKKDIYAFNDMEIEEFLFTIRRSSVISVTKSLSIISRYVDWTIANGKRGKYENGFNNVKIFINATQDLSKYVSDRQLSSKILNRAEYQRLIDGLVNPMDKALMMCFYNFIGGTGMYEIRSMTSKSINHEEGTLTLINEDGDERTQTVSKDLIEQLTTASKIDDYRRNDLEPWSVGRGEALTLDLADTPYIFRPIARTNNAGQMITLAGLNSKIRTMKKDTGFNYITPTSIRDSHIVQEVVDEMKSRELVRPNDDVYDVVFKRLLERYNLDFSTMQSYSLKKKVSQLLEFKEF